MQILKQAEGGIPVADLCREYGISNASFYKWGSNYSGMGAALLSEMKMMVEENKWLKREYAESQMQNELFKERSSEKSGKTLTAQNDGTVGSTG